ncbi:ferrous iron transporter B [Ottowia sp.]|uniref:ferrous iron transporter B n=1 Tax=Ottowia sp. TaxID=1898956 RepID=UPI001DD2DF49|nr:ferrous iron transporter B [Ottowia sp.]MCP5258087.1 ferrous iron transporter B [Burkholderiaceae bacterium]MCB2025995.1 ferrous iron transporter B [Ottowia sp.]MCB2032567.1 ferrous iron transporter B [Ottowia sp.]HPK32375.1 ferrous iron transporter B [Ottowia sp.]HRW72317.1 ferrous iron transporter B [Ottowia sp.]
MASTARPLRVALLGNPNCGKTALFNLLTGSRQKVANYAGVTVERKEGRMHLAGGREVVVLDLPGAYSLNALSVDEEITRDVVTGRRAGEALPDLLVCVVDATKLRLNLRLVLEAKHLGIPMVVALNMSDMAERLGIQVNVARLAELLGVPVVPTVAVQHDGARGLAAALAAQRVPLISRSAAQLHAPGIEDVMLTQREVQRIVQEAVQAPAHPLARDDAIDRVLLHPLWGVLVLAAVLFLMFQAVFSWAAAPMDWIKAGMDAAAGFVNTHMTEGPLRSLLADGVIAGVGSVLVFLPQILILFLFILALEDSGYLPRAAFLLDRVMGRVGLSGRSFIPLLSSFACAVPGIMATRTITHWRDRLVTIMIAPLMTCSARLPVYALLIAAFIPQRAVAGWFNLQGLVLFALYLAGIVGALGLAWAYRLSRRGEQARPTPLIMELPAYRWPSPRQLAYGLWERARIFLQRVGGIILAVMVLLWFLSTYPAAPEGATQPAILYSWAGQIGLALQKLLAPLGFNWQIAIALVPGMAAREVAVGALGTVYALSAAGDNVAQQLEPLLAHSWSLATALSLLAWYVFAPQCVSTLVAVRRETNGWRYPLVMLVQLFGMAYVAAFITYRVAVALGAG